MRQVFYNRLLQQLGSVDELAVGAVGLHGQLGAVGDEEGVLVQHHAAAFDATAVHGHLCPGVGCCACAQGDGLTGSALANDIAVIHGQLHVHTTQVAVHAQVVASVGAGTAGTYVILHTEKHKSKQSNKNLLTANLHFSILEARVPGGVRHDFCIC